MQGNTNEDPVSGVIANSKNTESVICHSLETAYEQWIASSSTAYQNVSSVAAVAYETEVKDRLTGTRQPFHQFFLHLFTDIE